MLRRTVIQIHSAAFAFASCHNLAPPKNADQWMAEVEAREAGVQ
jgi:hypothetical protein